MFGPHRLTSEDARPHLCQQMALCVQKRQTRASQVKFMICSTARKPCVTSLEILSTLVGDLTTCDKAAHTYNLFLMWDSHNHKCKQLLLARDMGGHRISAYCRQSGRLVCDSDTAALWPSEWLMALGLSLQLLVVKGGSGDKQVSHASCSWNRNKVNLIQR